MVATAADILMNKLNLSQVFCSEVLFYSRLAPYPFLFSAAAGLGTETTAAEVLPAGGTAPLGEFPLPDSCCAGGGACILEHPMEPYTELESSPTVASHCKSKHTESYCGATWAQ